MAGVYTPEQEKEIAYSLEKLHFSPMKYNYFGEGAKRWFHYAETARSQTASKGIHILEKILLTQKVDTIFDSLSVHGYRNVNLIDIGVGDGGPIYPIFQYMQYKRPNSKLRYNAIDISPDMLRAASKNIKEGFEVYGEHNLWDIERGSFEHITKKLRRPGYSNLFMFLGSTFGNMPDMHQVLVNIRKSMEEEDYFLLGVEMANIKEEDKMLRDYYKSPAAFDLLSTVVEYYGAKRAYFEFRIFFNRKLSQVEGYIIPDRNIDLQVGERKVMLKKKQPIMMLFSVKFNPPWLVDIFSKAGFRVEMLTTSTENNYALILTQPMP